MKSERLARSAVGTPQRRTTVSPTRASASSPAGDTGVSLDSAPEG
jgi:hypothetical protein